MEITHEIAQTIHPDSPILTAYESGRVRAFRGLAEPAGATQDLRRGYHDAEMEMQALRATRATSEQTRRRRNLSPARLAAALLLTLFLSLAA